MQSNSFQERIKNQSLLMQQQMCRFTKGFLSKQIIDHNYTPYIETLKRIFQMNTQFTRNFYQLLDKDYRKQLLENNKILIGDCISKLKNLSFLIPKFNIVDKNQSQGLCKGCNMLIHQRNLAEAKKNLDDVSMTELQKVLKSIEKDNQSPLYSHQEDTYFFRQLNRVLNKKQEVLAVTDNHIEEYLGSIIKNLNFIKTMENEKQPDFALPPNINWESKIKGQINDFLLQSFKGKVPPWIHKIFQNFLKNKLQAERKSRQSKSMQTDTYISQESISLRVKIQELKDKQKTHQQLNVQQEAQIKILTDRIGQLQQLINGKQSQKVSPYQSKGNSSQNLPCYQSKRNSYKQKNNTIISSSSQKQKKNKYKSLISSLHKNELHDDQNPLAQYLINQNQLAINSNDLSYSKNTSNKRKNKINMEKGYYKENQMHPNTNRTSLPPIFSGMFKPNQSQINKLKKTSMRSQIAYRTDQYGYSIHQQRRNLVQVDQNSEKSISANTITQQNILRYKQTVGIVDSHLQKKIKNMEIFKSSELKAKHSLLDVSNRNFNKNKSQKYQLPRSLNGAQKSVYSYRQNDSSYQSPQNISLNNLNKLSKPKTKVQTTEINIQTDNQKINFLYDYIDNEIFSMITKDQLQKVLKKLFEKNKAKLNINENIQSTSRQAKIQSQQKSEKKETSLTLHQNSHNLSRHYDASLQSSVHLSPKKSHAHSQQYNQFKIDKIIDRKYLFSKADFCLFLGQQNTFRYESSFKKKYHKTATGQLTTDQTVNFSSMYGIIQLIKSKSIDAYNQILSFIKYPYQTVVNNFTVLNIVKEMNINTFLIYMARIKYYHRKCYKKDDHSFVCHHIQTFDEKIENILVSLSYQPNFKQPYLQTKININEVNEAVQLQHLMPQN